MANVYWVSSNGAGNDVASWSTGALPGSSSATVFDLAIFNGRSAKAWTSGALTGHPSFRVDSRNQAPIGQPGKGIITGTEAIVGGHVFRGDADIWIGKSDATVSIVADMGLGTLHLADEPTTGSVVDTISLYCKGGRTIIGQQCGDLSAGNRSSLWVTGITARVDMEVANGATGFEDVIVSSGVLNNRRTFANATDTLTVTGGKCVQTGLLPSMHVYVAPGGVLEYAPISDPSGGAPNFYIDGLLDLSRSQFAITAGKFIIGPSGDVIGSPIETGYAALSLDLTEDMP